MVGVRKGVREEGWWESMRELLHFPLYLLKISNEKTEFIKIS
jgi:hypothetical protein